MGTVLARLVERQPWGDPGRGVAAGTRPWALYGREQEEPLVRARPAIVLPPEEPSPNGAPSTAGRAVPIPPGNLVPSPADDFDVAEAMPAAALAQVLRRRSSEDEPEPHDDDVPIRSFADDLDRKVALRRVMGRRPGDDEDDDEDDDDQAREEEEPERRPGGGAQFTKEEVNYRYSGNPERMCGVCRYFVAPGACEIVGGLIRPVDVCDKFERRGQARGAERATRAALSEQWDDDNGDACEDFERDADGRCPDDPDYDWETRGEYRGKFGGLAEFDPSQTRDPGGRFSGRGGAKDAFRVTRPAGAERAPGVVAVGQRPAARPAAKPTRPSLLQRLRAFRPSPRTPEFFDAEQAVPSYPSSGGVNLGALGRVVPSVSVPSGGMRAEEGLMKTVRARLVESDEPRVCREAGCFGRHVETTPPGFESLRAALGRDPWSVAVALMEDEAGTTPHSVTFGGGKQVRFSRHSDAEVGTPAGAAKAHRAMGHHVGAPTPEQRGDFVGRLGRRVGPPPTGRELTPEERARMRAIVRGLKRSPEYEPKPGERREAVPAGWGPTVHHLQKYHQASEQVTNPYALVRWMQQRGFQPGRRVQQKGRHRTSVRAVMAEGAR